MDIFSSKRFSDIYMKVKDQPRIFEVERIPIPTEADFLTNIAPRGYPVIFPLPQSPKRSWEQVRRVFGKYPDIKLKVRTGEYYKPDNYLTRREYIDITLREYLDKMISDQNIKGFYAGNQALPASIWDDLSLRHPEYYNRSDFEPPAFWLGPKGSITPLHKDSTDNFALHLLGQKRWSLFPVRDAQHLYMKRAMDRPGSDFAPSGVDLTAPDLQKFPDFKKAAPVVTVLEAGEVLYLPAGWGHFVENLQPSLMVNVWVSLDVREPAVILNG